MKTDLHLHSEYSPDGHIDLSWLAGAAVRLGYDQIAVTDHVDPPDDPYTPFDPDRFRACRDEVIALRKDHPGLSLIFGAEVGEFHLNEPWVRSQFANTPPELVIGSIHVVDGVNVSVPMPEPPTPDLVRAYYLANLETARIAGVDILGHLGIYLRYLPDGFDETPFMPVIDEILATVIRRGICLEVNSSGLRRPFAELIPAPPVLIRYRELGGRLLCLGSDSHVPDHFDRCREEALTRLRELGFDMVYHRGKSGWEPSPLCTEQE